MSKKQIVSMIIVVGIVAGLAYFLEQTVRNSSLKFFYGAIVIVAPILGGYFWIFRSRNK